VRQPSFQRVRFARPPGRVHEKGKTGVNEPRIGVELRSEMGVRVHFSFRLGRRLTLDQRNDSCSAIGGKELQGLTCQIRYPTRFRYFRYSFRRLSGWAK
jgi:hypothetical protein